MQRTDIMDEVVTISENKMSNYEQEKQPHKEENYMAYGISFGMLFGAGVGTFFLTRPLSVAIGASIGMLLGMIVGVFIKKK